MKNDPVFRSHAATHEATKIPLDVLSKAKRLGVAGMMEDGSVHLLPLLRWFFETFSEQAVKIDWLHEVRRVKAQRDQIELDRARGLVIERKEVVERLKVEHARIRAALDRHIRVELPAKCAGKNAEDIAEQAELALNAAYREISKLET
jgi:hypothetical protein